MSMAVRLPVATHRPVLLEGTERQVATRRRSAWRRLGWTGAEALGFLRLPALPAVFGPPFWIWGALDQHMDALLQDPTVFHPLGTDEFGRDILARLLLGARWSLAGAAIICAGTSLLGFFIAALAVSSNRRMDTIVGRVIEAM